MVPKSAMNASASVTPLSPQVMASAGVPIKEALWYARIPAGRPKMQALTTPTGNRILERVRAFQVKVSARDAMPLAA